MNVTQAVGERPIKLWTEDVEASAMEQLHNIAGLPFIDPHGVVAMPDVHYGIGATVGSVIATRRAIIPAAVGVDIGCGMNAILTNLTASDLPDSLAALRSEIEARVPTGFASHDPNKFNPTSPLELFDRYLVLKAKHPSIESRRDPLYQLGTLGGGNHFIELCLDENQNVWIMLHSGSRGIGNIIGRYFIEKAKRLMEQYYVTLPDTNLAYFAEDTQEFNDYVEAVGWAQDYASENRKMMMWAIHVAIMTTLDRTVVLADEAINCHHNYVERENHFGHNVWLTRKGAIRAREGDLGIIPGSMGQRSYIVRGLGNPDSYHSCSHGAGRRMGRKEARRQFTVADLEAQTQGVECRKDEAVLDEIPSSYKDIDVVMANQRDLVDVVHTLKQVLCVKGA
jgi:tRNA-splicing ligase RtcB